MTPDQITHQILLQATRERVWHALTDAAEFGAWFRVRLDEGFMTGQRTSGHITYPGYEHIRFEVDVQRMEPMHHFSWHWHPFATDSAIDYSMEHPTLVTFDLKDADGGTLLRVTETGFGQVPAARRDEAFRMNDAGWAEQMRNIQRHVDS